MINYDLGSIVKVFTACEKVKSSLQGLVEEQKLSFVTKLEKCDIVVFEVTKEEEFFGLQFYFPNTTNAKMAYFNKEELRAYIELIWRFRSNEEKFVLGGMDDIRFVSAGKVLHHMKKRVSPEVKEFEHTLFEENETPVTYTGVGLIVAKMSSLVRMNYFTMEVESLYGMVDFITCACICDKGEEETIEVFVFGAK